MKHNFSLVILLSLALVDAQSKIFGGSHVAPPIHGFRMPQMRVNQPLPVVSYGNQYSSPASEATAAAFRARGAIIAAAEGSDKEKADEKVEEFIDGIRPSKQTVDDIGGLLEPILSRRPVAIGGGVALLGLLGAGPGPEGSKPKPKPKPKPKTTPKPKGTTKKTTGKPTTTKKTTTKQPTTTTKKSGRATIKAQPTVLLSSSDNVFDGSISAAALAATCLLSAFVGSGIIFAMHSLRQRTPATGGDPLIAA